jgi:5'-deoxynucleotidase YfbR-like HD superfamily hydrolase
MTILLETVTGKLVDIENPDPATICIDDIAWGLSRMARFCGHTITTIPYNVAQHSVFVADEVQRLCSGIDYEEKELLVLKALLHDAAEVYTGDWPSPVKRLPALQPIIKEIEYRLMDAIYVSLRLAPPTVDEQNLIKQADRIAQKIEAHAFMPSRGAHWPNMPTVSLERLQSFQAPQDSLTSYKLFMDKFNALRTPK